jgi:hypothetical protein
LGGVEGLAFPLPTFQQAGVVPVPDQIEDELRLAVRAIVERDALSETGQDMLAT